MAGMYSQHYGAKSYGPIPTTASVTRMFFDRPAVINAVGKGSAEALRKAGMAVMYKARGSMRKLGAKRMARGEQWKSASKPGKPPRNWEGIRKRGGLLANRLFAYFDPATRSVIVGPEGLGGATAPRVLEEGGTARIPNRSRIIRKLGKTGEIRLGGKWGKHTKESRVGPAVTYATLRTQAQVELSNRINEELYGPLFLTGKYQAPRPYMAPALEKTKAKLPEYFRDTIRT